jgi:gliding motility-associated-like protein
MLLNNFRLLLLLALFGVFSTSFAQCFDIETILVAACDSGGATPDEGFNEMVRFKVGPTAINTSNMSVNFPSNTWQGLIQNGTTAAKVIQLNNQIAALGGCAQLLQPTGGVLPANAKVILVTSQNFSVSANVFGPISQNMYIIFQNNTTQTGGHFGNYGTTSPRTLTISFGACTDTVTYDRSLLVTTAGVPGGGDGSSVNFTPAGVASYFNLGCFAPIDPFTVDAGTVSTTPCAGTTINLVGSAQGYTAVQWTATSGTFGSANSLSSSYTIPSSATGNIQLNLTATNACGATVSDNVTFSVATATVPNFSSTLSLCSGAAAPALNASSPNGIAGTWSPSTISNTTGNTYVFTPNSGQCATTANTVVSITAQTVPNFATTLALCTGSTAPALNVSSPNGILGTWSPSTISNTTGNTYVFTPNAGQCATSVNTVVTVSSSITPNFATTLTLCSGAPAPALNASSPNGIAGTWSPSTISNTTGNTYVFTPNSGQCATSANTVVSITAQTVPNFVTTLALCSGATAPALNASSPNGIAGTWSPSTISNTTGNTYVFTPNAGQCATSVNTVVTVSSSITPNFATTLTLCSGATAPALNASSPNGILGTWSPSTISNTTGNTYVFTPNAGQCATTANLVVSVSPNSVQTATYAICLDATGQATLPALIDTGLLASAYTFTWTKDGIALPDTTSSISVTAAGSYEAIATNLSSNCIVTLMATVQAVPKATAVASVQYDFASEQLIHLAVSGGQGPFSYQLNGGNSQLSPDFTIYQGGDYQIHITEPNGCNTFDLEVTALFYPKFFTPNGDGYNDSWNISGDSFQDDSELYIFDRMGKLLKQIAPNGPGWNGTYNGHVMPSSDYWFLLKYISTTGQAKEFKANFSLKR